MSEPKTILVATNDSETERELTNVLTEGYIVRTVESSSEALLTLLEKDIDLIVIDLSIDGMTGLETIPIIRRTRPKIPLIVLSDDDSVETGSKVAQEGVFYYALKPLNAAELEQVAKAALKSSTKS
ncbi:MAG: response regulator [bacterium]